MKPRLCMLALLCGLVLLTPPLLQGRNGNPNPGVLPPGARAYGMTYGAWGAAWWNWALSSSLADNPVADETGANCHVNQAGPVWFLAGTFGGPAVRHCHVPAGKALFFPIINTVWWATEPDETEEEIREGANATIDQVTVLECSINGVPLKKLDAYRADSPAFTLHLPEGAIADELFDLSGDFYPAVADGYWIMLAPLPRGKHVIHFRGVQGDPNDPLFETEVTYFLTVGP
jgi:hypothetical protein